MDPYIKAMFGESAIHVPLHFIVQDQSKDTVLIVGACRMPSPHPLRFGSNNCHQLFLGDAVFRPKMVCESQQLRGYGIAGLATSSAFADPKEWERVIIQDGIRL